MKKNEMNEEKRNCLIIEWGMPDQLFFVQSIITLVFLVKYLYGS